MLFVNLFGIVVAAWSLIRILRPDPFQCLVEIGARVGISLLLAYYLFFSGVTKVVAAFLVPEIILLVLLVVAYRGRPRRAVG